MAGVGALLLAAACGQAPAQPAAQPAAKPSAAEVPKPGGAVIVASGSDPGTLENSLNLGSDTQRILIEIYDRLINEDLSVDAPIPPLVPGLAQSWSVSPDGLQYTFKLREGVAFHDGTPFDANAVKFNIDRLTQPNSPFYYARGAGATKIVYGRVASVDVVDARTVRIQLSQPYANFADTLSLPIASFASPENIKKLGTDEQGERPSGTGPFKFVERQKGTKLVLGRNPTYWGGPPPLEQVVVRPIPEPTAAVSALLAGEVHLVAPVPADSVASIKARPELEVKVVTQPYTFCLNFNTREKPLDDVRVRRALNYAVDRETYTRDLLKGLGVPAKSVFGPTTGAHDPALKGYPYDLDKAKALLKEAGLEQGFALTIQAPKAFGADSVAVYLKDNLAKIGVNVKVELLEFQTLASMVNKDGLKPGIGGLCWSWNCRPNFNFDRFFTSAFGPPNGVNFGFYANPKVDQLLDQANRTTDTNERTKMYRQLDSLVTDDAAWLFIYHPLEPRASSKKLSWVSANSGFWFTLRNATLQ